MAPREAEDTPLHKRYGFPYDPKKEKKSKKGDQKSKNFKSLSEHERVFYRSHIYGGTHANTEKELPVYDEEKKIFVNKTITTPDLLIRLFEEIICNAKDNVIKSRLDGVNTECIDIVMEKYKISVENDGLPIPLEPHEEMCKGDEFGTVVDLVFGVLGSGSNMDDDYDKNTGGQNGTGAKLNNVQSTYFQVEVGDNIRGVHQVCTWQKNMTEKVESTCTPSYIRIKNKKGKKKWVLDDSVKKYKGKNFVKVTYVVDFRKYEQKHYTEDDIALFKRYAIDASYAVKVPVYFNGEKYDYRDFNNYCKVLGHEDSKNRIVIHSFKNGETVPEDKKERDKMIRNGELVPEIELCMICAPGKGYDISYTNGIYNREGGAHTNEAYRVVLDGIKKIVSSDKKYGITPEEAKSLNIKTLKPNAILVINYLCKNPSFESQMKHKLESPKPKIPLSEANFNALKKWKIMDMLYDKFNTKKEKVDKGRIANEKFQDALNFGNPNKPTECIWSEGLSAGEYCFHYMDELGRLKDQEGGGRENMTVLALQGKIKNVSGLENKEIYAPEKSGKESLLTRVKRIMGFNDGVDYRNEKEADRELRYKRVLAMVDADHDGYHILGLIINFILRRFPTFIKARRLRWSMMPVLRAIKPTKSDREEHKKTIKNFYTIEAYEKWKVKHSDVVHQMEYYKGLASASIQQAKEDARDSPKVVMFLDKKGKQSIKTAFNTGSGSADIRKQWILDNKDVEDKNIIKEDDDGYYAKISDIVNYRVSSYSWKSITRAIPGIDQLKESTRKAYAYIAEMYKFGKDNKRPVEKLGNLAGKISSDFHYHHAEKALSQTLAKNTQDFAGSNNLPFLTHESQTGSRYTLGKSMGDGRYTKSKPSWSLKYILIKEIYDLVKRINTEGDLVEPEMIPFLVPLSVINGVTGVAMGWSTFMTKYHPGDVAEFVLRYISGKKVFPMVPWFINYKGKVTLEVSNEDNMVEEKDDEDNTDNEDEDSDEEKVKVNMRGLILKTEGKFKILKQRKKVEKIKIDDPENIDKKKEIEQEIIVTDFEITEFPIGICPKELELSLGKNVVKGGFSKMVNPKSEHELRILVNGYKGSMKPEDIFMIQRKTLSNITLLNKEGIPVKYDNVYQTIVDYCEHIKKLFELRKIRKLEELEVKKAKITQEAKLIKECYKGRFNYINTKRKNVEDQLKNYEIPYSIFSGIKSDRYTIEGYEECLQEVGKIEDEIKETQDGDYLKEWKDKLKVFYEEIYARKQYIKEKKHEYEIVKCSIEDLTSGKIVAPYKPEVYKRKLAKEKKEKEDTD